MRGEYVFAAAGCAGCHSAKDQPPLAGGRALETGFGIFYAPNITPDPETGIGRWSGADLYRALRQGLRPDGRPYYPSLPYLRYTGMSDADLADLWAYLRSLEPVRQANRAHELDWPFGWRPGLNLWRARVFRERRWRPDPARTDAYNRGSYLVEVLGHCDECHTPRGLFGEPDVFRRLAGTAQGPSGEKVPNITPDRETGIGKWSRTDLLDLLESGALPNGDYVGDTMAEVVDRSTSKLTAFDRVAIATWLLEQAPVAHALGDARPPAL